MSPLDVSIASSQYEMMQALQQHLNQHIIGQPALILRLLIALLADGHLLLEGAPGLAKTKAIKALAAGIDADFQRVQFTPDLLPADLTGTDIYRPQTADFIFEPGPLFHHVILADEINRAPAKVQAALLEAMAERQITIGHHTYALPALYFVMATQNPIEQEGTYPLPEAMLDRFLMYVKIEYPSGSLEKNIMALAREEARHPNPEKIANTFNLAQSDIFEARREVLDVYLSPMLEEYIVQLVLATREPHRYSRDAARWLRMGVSPRASIGLDRSARAHAWLHGRDYVSPDDIVAIVPDILRHRLLLSFEAQAEGVTADDVITHFLNQVVIP